MSKNFHWTTEKASDGEMRVVFFTSRNKDNENLDGFVQRRKAFVTYDYPNRKDRLLKAFRHFEEDGVPGEVCRLYISVDIKDEKKVKQALQHYLIDTDEINWQMLEAKVAGIAANKTCSKTRHWLFDFDSTDGKLLNDFLSKMCVFYDGAYVVHKTPHGYAIVLDHGFDIRELHLENYPYVSLKKDAMLCLLWTGNEEFEKLWVL